MPLSIEMGTVTFPYFNDREHAPAHAIPIVGALLTSEIMVEFGELRRTDSLAELFSGSNSNLALIWVAAKPFGNDDAM